MRLSLKEQKKTYGMDTEHVTKQIVMKGDETWMERKQVKRGRKVV